MAGAIARKVRYDWWQKITTGLGSLFRGGKLCDFTIITNYKDETQSVECHRSVLAVASTYFADKLMVDGKDNDINFLEISDFETKTIKEAVAFLYQGQCQITKHNVTDLLALGELWSVPELRSNCFEFMCNNSSLENCVEYYELCTKKKADPLITRTLCAFIRTFFTKLQENNRLIHLSVTGFKDILASGRISRPVENVVVDEMSNENVVFEALKQWIEANPDLSFDPLLPLIKYDYMTDEYLQSNVFNSPLLSSERKSLIEMHIKERALREKLRKSAQSGTTTNPGKGLLKVDNARNLCQLRIGERNWRTIKKIPDWVDHGTAICVYGSQVLFAGTSSGNCRQCYILDIYTALKSFRLPDLPASAPSAGITHTGRHVYITGGYPACRAVYRINLHTCSVKWEQGTPMLDEVWCHKSWYHRGHVYVVGGYDTKGYTRSTQRYNISDDTWSQGADAPTDINAYHNKGVQVHNQTHFFMPTQRVTYDSDRDQWSVKPYKRGQLEKYTTPVMYENNMLVLHSPDRYSRFNICQYNEADNTWTDVDIDVRSCLFTNMLF